MIAAGCDEDGNEPPSLVETIRLCHKTASADQHRKASHATPCVQSQHPGRDHDVQLLCARPNAAGDLVRGPRPCRWPRAGSRHPHLWWKPTCYQSATGAGQQPKEAAAAKAQELAPPADAFRGTKASAELSWSAMEAFVQVSKETALMLLPEQRLLLSIVHQPATESRRGVAGELLDKKTGRVGFKSRWKKTC